MGRHQGMDGYGDGRGVAGARAGKPRSTDHDGPYEAALSNMVAVAATRWSNRRARGPASRPECAWRSRSREGNVSDHAGAGYREFRARARSRHVQLPRVFCERRRAAWNERRGGVLGGPILRVDQRWARRLDVHSVALAHVPDEVRITQPWNSQP